MTKATPARDDFETHLKTLVDKFERHRADYLRPDYSEAQVRIDFIDPFFEALGWDVHDHAALGPRERQVVVEKGETSGNPDYNFRHQGRTVFFAEAKAPHVPLERTDVVMQAKSYAWNSRDVFLAAITDFEEFRLYDATPKPDRRHPDVGLIFAYRCGEYLQPKALDDLWLLSLESVAGGSIDRLLKRSTVLARQKIPVDQAFLDDLTGWREQLAKAVYKHEPGISVADLNSVVQVFLDRLIFVRLAEDRGILPPRGLEDIAREWEHSGKRRSIRDALNDLFREVNLRLNGEIFKPHQAEKIDWDPCADLVAKIIAGLYPPSPYRFDVIGVELLGSIYERYLGKTIRVTATRAVVEDKPEVRKAGGVYYTPKYIVDYIVEQTVGKLIKGKTPRQTLKLRVLDPACGSGSFLLAAYQRLIDHHERWYTDQARRKRARRTQPTLLAEGEGGEFRLSLAQKAEIVRNCIYGVDIDPQAVEITMMSLYIKMLEGEKGAIAGRGVLPPLRDNIKCGNSLISHDIARQPDLFGELTPADLNRINPFDWESKSEGFGEILEEGGFDVVVGNPPYLFITHLDETEKRYFAGRYGTCEYRFDVYGLFIEASVQRLLRIGGCLGFITPHTLLNNDSFEKLRRLLLDHTAVELVVDIGPGVFEGAKNETMIIVLRRGAPQGVQTNVILTNAVGFPKPSNTYSIRQTLWKANPKAAWLVRVSSAGAVIVSRLERAGWKLADLCTINQGLRTGDNQRFLSDHPASHEWKPAAGGKQVGRYMPLQEGLYVLYEPGRLDAPRRREIFESGEKLVVQEIRNITLPRRIVATYDDRQFFCLQSTNVVNSRPDTPSTVCLKYILGIMNSCAANYFFRQRFSGNNHIASNQLATIPVPIPDPKVHDEIITLVERMLELHKQRQGATSDAARARIEREIHVTDEKIDALVYELYGLTDEEVRIVEESG